MLTPRILRGALRSRFWDQRPFILSHLVTARCNADCATCLWKKPAASLVDEMTASEIAALYQDAATAGCVALSLWGGEPMVRQDVAEVLRSARDARLNTTLITNGWWLAERGAEILPWTDRLIVSVDAVGPLHDEIRKCKGLFERLDRGLAYMRRHHPGISLVILAVLSRLNSHDLQNIAHYGTQFGARVVFQSMNLTDYGFADRRLDLRRLQLDADEEREVADVIARLKRRGYPVHDSGSYLRRLGSRGRNYRCHYKKVLVRVEPNGNVLDCTRTAVPLANVRQNPLSEFLRSDEFRRFTGRAEGCNRCEDAGVIEASNVWEGRPDALWNALTTV